MEETEKPQTAKSSSLFPVASSFNNNNSTTESEWLRNQSFTADLSVINDAVSKYESNLPPKFEEEEEEEEEDDKDKNERPQYELLESSASDEDEQGKETRRKNKKKKNKRKRKELYVEHPSSYGYYRRKPHVEAWAASSSSSSRTVPPTKDYYFDSRGDPDNLAFASLYKMDIARYKLFNSRKALGGLYYYYRSNQNSKGLVGEADIDALDSNLRSEGRYWSPKYAVLERHKNMKRIRIVAPQQPLPSLATDFIPISSDDNTSSSLVSSSRPTFFEESWEEEMLRKTREFNKMTRERPHDENVWLAFADFQDKVSSTQTQKGARLQTLEKKISILEKAFELNPDSEDLLLSLMNGYQSRDTTDVLIGRWEKILVQNSGSYKLWKEFLRVIQGEFSRFKVSEMRKIYANAIRALFGACSKQYRQVHKSANVSASDPSIVQLELGLVDTFISMCRFEWQAGYKELATALFQAEIEYSLFSPSLLLSEQSKQRLFEYFWNSNGARVGEEGALGWANWLEKEEEQRQRIINEELSQKGEEEGGWTGWSEPLSKNKESSEVQETPPVGDVAVENMDGSETRDLEQDDTESLLKLLGIDAAAEANGEVKDPKTWSRWAEEELNRDSDQWMPIRSAPSVISQGTGIDDADGDEQLSRVILFEDVSDYLFSINSEEARQSLVSQFIDFCGGKIAQWTCTNSSSWAERSLSLEDLPHSIREDLRSIHEVLTKDMNIQIGTTLELLLGSVDEMPMRTRMMKFLRNATLLCLTAFPQKYKLQEAALIAEELSNTQMNSSSSPMTPCRGLAKNLLKSNRQDLLLCGVYARREAVFGNIDLARKVFDLALLSIEGLPSDIQLKASLLYLWYAEVEVANGSICSTESSSRAMHILTCLGSGEKYSPYRCQPSNLQQLRARQGFKERIRTISSDWACGIVDDHSIALICSAALFEELTTGWLSAIEMLDQAFTMVLPERRRHSCQLELLFNYYVEMLCKHHAESRLSKLWVSVVTGLQIYPFSPDLYNALIKISHLHTSPNKLRFVLDDICRKKPSVIVWLFALSFEMSKGCSLHRIRGLFERALENGKLQNCVILWRCYIAYEINIARNPAAARRVYFRAIHACPWSKRLWFDGFLKLYSVLTAKELSDLQEVMRDKELNLRTDIYEILLQDEMES